jgi:hypothetical protein
MRGVTNAEQRKSLVGQIIDYSNDVLPTPGGRSAGGYQTARFVLGIVRYNVSLEWKMRRLTKVGVAEFIGGGGLFHRSWRVKPTPPPT